MSFKSIVLKEAFPEEVLKDIHHYFSSSGQSLCVAESLTGGLLSFYLSHLPGASHYFKGGIVAYQTDLKIRQLGLSEKMIQKEGFSSKACAEAMAQGIKKICAADWALAVTGFAGPKGGTVGEPVGQVAFAVQSKHSTHSEIKFFNCQGQKQEQEQRQDQRRRESIRHQAALFALHLLVSQF